ASSTAQLRVLAVGNPAFDRNAFPLASLPASEKEANESAQAYSRLSRTLTGAEATDDSLQRLAPSFDVIHFAGHAVARTDVPDMSYLVLASRNGSDGALFASDIAQWRLGRTKLVVLSGCSTSGGRLSATEGVSSLARAFFAAGVPQIVASLWEVNDETTAS